MSEAAARPRRRGGRVSAFWRSFWKFFAGSPMMPASIGVGIACGILWNPARWAAIALFVILSAYTLVVEAIDIVKGWMARRAGSDLLAVIAIISASLVGAFWAAWIVDLMVFTGGAIEEFAQAKAGQNLAKLIENAPKSAHVARGGGSYETVKAEAVKMGDALLVKPGETVPVDGFLACPSATVDMSMINGEPVPQDLKEGDKVFSGAVNGGGALYMEASTTAQNSEYQQILKLVERAGSSRAPIVKAADLLAVPFTVISLVIGIAAWAASQDPVRFVQVMVLATPCPLLIAAPVAYMGGIGRLAKHGIIVKSQGVVEQMGKVRHVFFDKTGTLTSKTPKVCRVECAPGTDANEALKMAGALESCSAHVLAKSIASSAAPLFKISGAMEAKGVKEEAGSGMEGIVDGVEVAVGKGEWLEEKFGRLPSFPALDAGEMGVYVAIGRKTVARIALKDLPRPGSKDAIKDLKKLGIGKITMLTGDKRDTANSIASQLGIEDVRAGLMPEEKLDTVLRDKKEEAEAPAFGKREHVTMMVGDGVNDAPTLASADIGMAMTDGSATVASESAQAVVMNDEISSIPKAIAISKQTRRVMFQSVMIGMSLALILMVLAAFNLIPVIIGALLQEAVDSISIFWALGAIIDKKTEIRL